MSDITSPVTPPDTPPTTGKKSLPTSAIDYDADTGRVFQIWFLNGLFRILTLGIYTFWGKTRMRRYLASGFLLDGDRFEYTGTGKELFFGFLKAIPIYLIAIGPFIAVNIWLGDEESLKVLWIFPAYIPLIYFFPFAYYAARRYRLSRTTWRGIRFALKGSAFKYANYAMFRAFLNTITLGILTPYSQAYLHKHVVDHMIFGNIPATLHTKAFNFKKLVRLNITSAALFIIYPLLAVGIAFAFGANKSGIDPIDEIAFQVENDTPILLDDNIEKLEIPEEFKAPNGLNESLQTLEQGLEEIEEDLETSQKNLELLEKDIEETEKNLKKLKRDTGFALAILLGFLFMIPIWIVLRLKYAAEMLRGKVNGMVIGQIRFKSKATAMTLFRLHLGNGFISFFTFGWGKAFIIQRRMRFLKNNIIVGGDLNGTDIQQAALQQAGVGEGIDDIFDFDTGFIGGGII